MFIIQITFINVKAFYRQDALLMFIFMYWYPVLAC